MPPNSYSPELFLFGITSVRVSNCSFINSPWIGMGFIEFVSGVVVDNSHFANAANLGIWSSAGGSHDPFEVPGGNARCGLYNFARDITVVRSTFEENGGNGIHFDALDVRIIENTFRNNHRAPPPGFITSGGQIDITTCSHNVDISDNRFTDGSTNNLGGWADGIELHGTDIVLTDNIVEKNAGIGITLQGSQDVFVANWKPNTALFGTGSLPFYSGVYVVNDVGWRPAVGVTVDHANIVDGYDRGVVFENRTSDLLIDYILVTNNCLKTKNASVQVPPRGIGPNVVIANNATENCGPR